MADKPMDIRERTFQLGLEIIRASLKTQKYSAVFANSLRALRLYSFKSMFLEMPIRLIDKIPHTRAGNAIANQLIRSATSIGVNAQEALAASSKSDFIYKTNIALREARETQYWIRLLKESKLIVDKEIENLLQESDEITRIFGAIVSTARGKRKIR